MPGTYVDTLNYDFTIMKPSTSVVAAFFLTALSSLAHASVDRVSAREGVVRDKKSRIAQSRIEVVSAACEISHGPHD